MIDKQKTLSEKFLRKGFWLYLFSFIIAPIGYIVKILISGQISVEELGILYGIISLVTLISAYNDLGMTESIKHFIPKYVNENRYDKVKTIITYALIAQILTSLLVAGLFYFGADFIANSYFKTADAKGILKVFALFFIGINIFQTLNHFFMAVQNTFLHKITEFIRMGFILLSVLFVYFSDIGNLQNYSYAWLIGLYMGLVFCIIIFYTKYYKKYLKTGKIIWSKKLFKEISNYSFMVLLGASAGTILGQMDMQMIIYFLGTTDAGYYTNYLSIISIPFMLIGPIFALLFPVFSELYNKGEIEKIKLTKHIFTKVFLAVGVMFNIFFFVFADKIAFILFGEKFLESGNILRYSILFLIFNFLLQINFNIMSGIGRVKERVGIIIKALIWNGVFNILFIHFIGVAGAALATASGWILIYILSEYKLGTTYKTSFDYKNFFKNTFLMSLLGVGFYFLSEKLFENMERGISFMILFGLSIIWFGFFIGINYTMFRGFIGEIKKLRR